MGECAVHAAIARDFRHRLTLRSAVPVAKATHVLATGYAQSPFPPFHERAKARGWKTVTVPCGHDAMLDRPDDVVRILCDAAGIA